VARVDDIKALVSLGTRQFLPCLAAVQKAGFKVSFWVLLRVLMDFASGCF
jgi:hypothetical protein